MFCRDPSAGSTEVPDLLAQCEEMEAVPVSLLHRSGVHLCPDQAQQQGNSDQKQLGL